MFSSTVIIGINTGTTRYRTRYNIIPGTCS